MNVYRHIKNGHLYWVYRDRYHQIKVEPLYYDTPKLTCTQNPRKLTHYSGLESFTLAYTE